MRKVFYIVKTGNRIRVTNTKKAALRYARKSKAKHKSVKKVVFSKGS